MINYVKKNLLTLNNIGDVLCTPDNYFHISSDKNVIMVGGGVWNIEKLSKEPNAKSTIVWAAGRSIRYPKKASKLPNSNFLAAGFRDILDLGNKSTFLPCVSCLHKEIVKEPIGNKTLIFTNANNQVSKKIMRKDPSKIYLTNDCTEIEFLTAWAQCDKVITNSYHGVYWSLLSNRLVAPYGYSSKFTNVTAIFGIEFPKQNFYPVSSRNILETLIDKEQVFIQSNTSMLNHFQELNMEFAESLKRVGVKCKKI
jgi:hypothetical protein